MFFRKAIISDVEKIHELINYYAEKGLMLYKTMDFLYEHLRQYYVGIIDEEIVAVGALRIFWCDLAEICSLAVSPNHQRLGLGGKIVATLEAEAQELGLNKVFALTYQTDFFTAVGYHSVDLKELPLKVWKDCVRCDKADRCDEHAFMKIF